ncbi:GntR family transcriptional regulator [Streptomyces sp. JNUCC 64]
MTDPAPEPEPEINPVGRKTQYRQLEEILRTKIANGAWGPDQPIDSETKLVQKYGLARSTVRRAIAALAADGTVETVPGRGTYVAQGDKKKEKEEEPDGEA